MDSALSFPATKIQPPRARSARLSRPPLEAALREALLQSRVVLLQAAAGFGKTSALAAALPGLPEGTALAWVSLDVDDDAPRLLRCLAAALEAADLPWRTAPEALALRIGAGPAGASQAWRSWSTRWPTAASPTGSSCSTTCTASRTSPRWPGSIA